MVKPSNKKAHIVCLNLKRLGKACLGKYSCKKGKRNLPKLGLINAGYIALNCIQNNLTLFHFAVGISNIGTGYVLAAESVYLFCKQPKKHRRTRLAKFAAGMVFLSTGIYQFSQFVHWQSYHKNRLAKPVIVQTSSEIQNRTLKK